jgi:glycerol uptake facilitator-like aquaporin
MDIAVAKRFPAKQLPPYIISQLVGALPANTILELLSPENRLFGATLPVLIKLKPRQNGSNHVLTGVTDQTDLKTRP